MFSWRPQESSVALLVLVQYTCTGTDVNTKASVEFDVTEAAFNYCTKNCNGRALSVKLNLKMYAEEDKSYNLQDDLQVIYDTKCGFDATFHVHVDLALEAYLSRFKYKHPRSSLEWSNYETLLLNTTRSKAYLLDVGIWSIPLVEEMTFWPNARRAVRSLHSAHNNR